MDWQDEDEEEWLSRQGWSDSRAQQSMRHQQTVHRRPSQEDLKVRRRNRRATAGGDVQKRAELVRAVQKAGSLAEKAALLDEIAKIDEGLRAKAAQDRELDFAGTVVRETLSPVRVHEYHTAATDWIGYDEPVDSQWANKVVAEAAMWFGRVPDAVKADPEEFRIQAEGMAKRVAGPYGLHAEAAMTNFLDYTSFLHKNAASGLDQIQQTVDPNNQPKTTPMPEDVFDNFAPPIHPINEGVSGTEQSTNAPLIQEIVNGGSGMDGGAPEKPGGHSTDDELSWAPPSGMQQDTQPGWSDGDPGSPEQGGRPDYLNGGKSAARARKVANGLGKCTGCGKDLTVANAASVCPDCAKTASKREAASGLPMIQETVDANNQPHTPTPIPPEVAFPLDGDMQQEWTTNGTGNAQPTSGQKAGSRKQADMFGGGDAPHPTPTNLPVANSPATTPPTADNAGGASAGRSDAQANERPSFADDSSHVPAPAQQYAEGYSSVDQSGAKPESVPGSMVGPGNGITNAGAKVSSLIVTAAERENADFRKGYGYASRWTPGTRLVSTGSKEFEAGLYAGISDNAEHQKAFVAAHRAVAASYPKIAARVETHKQVTAHVVAKNEHPSNGLYLLASTSIDLNTMAPNTTPAADGSTPINGPGRPGPLDGEQGAAAPGGPAPYNGAEPFGSPVVPGGPQAAAGDPTDALIGDGHMSTQNMVMGKKALAFRQAVQAGLLAQRQGK